MSPRLSGEDCLPLGCDAHSLRQTRESSPRRMSGSKMNVKGGPGVSLSEERPAQASVRLACGPTGSTQKHAAPEYVIRNLPSSRFHLDGPDVQPTAATDYVRELLGAEDSLSGPLADTKVCMLRMQEPLVCTETEPGRTFKCNIDRDVLLAIGITAEGRNKIGALPKRFQVPGRPEKLRLVLVQARRGDVLALQTSPAVNYHVPSRGGPGRPSAPSVAQTIRGDVTLMRNDRALGPSDLQGPSDMQDMPLPHDFSVVDGICGIAFWVGGLTDVVEAC